MTVADAHFQVAFNTVYVKLREKAIKGAEKVTDKDIAAFYKKNKTRFAQPETRDLRVVLTKTKAKADAAPRRSRAATRWTAVAKKYSIDQASKGQRRLAARRRQGLAGEGLRRRALRAPTRASSTGPIKTQFGYYVFQVQKITPAKQQTLKEATPAIKQELTAQNQKKADDKFNKDLRKKWKEKTNCREGFVMDQCKNAPKPKTTTAAAGRSSRPRPRRPPPPQQAPPPQQP